MTDPRELEIQAKIDANTVGMSPEEKESVSKAYRDLRNGSDEAMSLGFFMEELANLMLTDDRQQLNCGLHMLSAYEKVITCLETGMHPSYLKQIDDVRAKIRLAQKGEDEKLDSGCVTANRCPGCNCGR